MPTVNLSPSSVFRVTGPTPRAIRVAFTLFVAAAVLIVFAKMLRKANQPSRLGDYTRTAILRWKPQIEALGRGENIYAAFNYPNPPIMAILLRPVVSLPPTVSAAVWFALKVTMAALLLAWSVRFVRGAGPPLPDLAVGLAVLLALQPILGDLAHGNINLFVAAVTFAALDLFRRRWDASAGVVLALAIACKVTPALFLPYFVWKRAWRVVAGCLVGLVLWFGVVPGAVLGNDYNRTLLTSWYERMVKPFVVDGQVTSEHPNQSIPGVVFRLLTSAPSFLEYGEDGNGPPEAAGSHTIVDLGVPAARTITKAVTLGFGLLILVACRARTDRTADARDGPRLAAEWSLILLGMLLLSERTWKHHAVTLVLPLLVLATAAVAAAPTRVRFVSRVALAVAAVLMVGQSLLPDRAQDLALVYGAHALAFVALTVGVGAVLFHETTAAVPKDGRGTGRASAFA
jgi:alpha-1,2-mannosyltransferase